MYISAQAILRFIKNISKAPRGLRPPSAACGARGFAFYKPSGAAKPSER